MKSVFKLKPNIFLDCIVFLYLWLSETSGYIAQFLNLCKCRNLWVSFNVDNLY